METRQTPPANGVQRHPAETPAIPQPVDVFNARDVIQVLQNLMTGVTAQEVTPSTVNAACNCAARITDLLRIHLDAERLKRSGHRQ